MKRFISILAAFIFAISFCVQTAGAAMIGDTAQTRQDLASVFSDSLRERLAQAADDDVIRVTIELTDGIDLDNIEMKAFSRAKISATEKASLVAEVYSLTEAENKSVQLEALNVQDRISKNRNALLEEYYTAKNNEFISSTCLKDAKIGSVGLFTPFIRDIKLTKTEILEIAANSEVCEINLVNELSLGYFDDDNISTRSSIFQDIDDTYKLIGGNTAVDAGYTGSGIRVGVIELGNPDTTKMGSDGKNITCDNDDIIVNYHATMVCGIIKKFAPSCSIYSKALSKYSTDDEIMDACSNLISNYTLHVLNLSFGDFGGKYTKSVREMDYIIRNTKVPIVVAAGNAKTYERSLDDGEVEVEILDGRINFLGMAANAITVGNALTVGTNPDALDAFTLADDSCYEETSPINKPDICAPGYVHIYSYEEPGTSFAAPHVTGTIVQMMSRNAAFIKQPQKVKAALLASATRNCGTSMSYIGNEISNEEGAGVLDAEFCYRLSRAGRATHFDATSSSGIFTHDVYCDYTTKSFRIACTWEVAAASSGETVNVSDYNMEVFKDGVLVASSMTSVGPTSSESYNGEIIEIPTSDLKKYGGGYYEVRISRAGSFKGSGTVRIGLAWEQD